MILSLTFQPLHPSMTQKGHPDVQGLRDRHEPLVIVLISAVYQRGSDDELVNRVYKEAIGEIDSFAAAHGTADPFRWLNYCASWQKPFEGYGLENLRFLRETSAKYDPDGLFQRACIGGFKLGIEEQAYSRRRNPKPAKAARKSDGKVY